MPANSTTASRSQGDRRSGSGTTSDVTSGTTSGATSERRAELVIVLEKTILDENVINRAMDVVAAYHIRR